MFIIRMDGWYLESSTDTHIVVQALSLLEHAHKWGLNKDKQHN